ncbi:MAG: endonuclease III [Candidatus Absconditabacterales bacterium]|nr:endonuclease III [Candidatus Absconditabacterales bacterium]
MPRLTPLTRLQAITPILTHLYPEPKTELVYHTPFQLLIAVILSAQTTDKQVNKVTEKFFGIICHPHDILARGQDNLTNAIAGVNYAPTKAKHIRATSILLANPSFWIPTQQSHPKAYDHYHTHGYAIPDTIDQLVRLPGVGEKTAKVVASILYDLPVIAVDTHVHRVSNRLGLCTTTQPTHTSHKLETLCTKAEKKLGKQYHDIHHRLILFGRYQCTAKKPTCHTCPFQNICRRYNTQKKTTKKKT